MQNANIFNLPENYTMKYCALCLVFSLYLLLLAADARRPFLSLSLALSPHPSTPGNARLWLLLCS